jgi:hypothetical protein
VAHSAPETTKLGRSKWPYVVAAVVAGSTMSRTSPRSSISTPSRPPGRRRPGCARRAARPGREPCTRARLRARGLQRRDRHRRPPLGRRVGRSGRGRRPRVGTPRRRRRHASLLAGIPPLLAGDRHRPPPRRRGAQTVGPGRWRHPSRPGARQRPPAILRAGRHVTGATSREADAAGPAGHCHTGQRRERRAGSAQGSAADVLARGVGLGATARASRCRAAAGAPPAAANDSAMRPAAARYDGS